MRYDICHLEAYTCSFEESYYKCEFDSDDQTIGYYNDLYFMKIQNPWGKKFMLEYSKEYGDSTYIDTLGNKIKFPQNWINQCCGEIRDTILMKKQNQGLCCSKLEELPRFGCSNKAYKNRKKFKRKKFFRINKKYYQKTNTRRSSAKGINLKEILKSMHPKGVNVDCVIKKRIM